MTDQTEAEGWMQIAANYESQLTSAEQAKAAAIDIALRYGGYDVAHYKMWVIDQMVRILAGDKYETIIAAARVGEDGPDTYEWDEGIAP